MHRVGGGGCRPCRRLQVVVVPVAGAVRRSFLAVVWWLSQQHLLYMGEPKQRLLLCVVQVLLGPCDSPQTTKQEQHHYHRNGR
jgi:hypothetical protein